MSRNADPNRNKNAVTVAIARIFREALTCRTEEELGRTCLSVAEELTDSRFGFIGEINSRSGRLDDIAISDPGWDVCRIPLRTGHGKCNSVSFEILGIYGRVLNDGKGLFTNDPSSHPDSVGAPSGHPPLRAFLGVPLIHAGKTIGMIGLGNREGGYGPDELSALEGLAPAIVQAFLSKRTETALRESEERLRLALDAANLIPFEWDIQRNQVWSHISVDPMRTQSDTKVSSTLNEVREAVHLEDREQFDTHVQAALESRDGHYQSEFRLLHPDGRVVWLYENGRVERDAKGRPMRLIGLSQDITRRKEAEAERERLLAERTAVMEGMSDALVLADPSGRIIYHNPASLALHGYASLDEALLEQDEMVAQWQILDLGGQPLPIDEWPMPRALRGETFSGYELRIRRQDTGREFIGSYSGKLVPGPESGMEFAMLTVRDITEQKRADEALLQERAKLDSIMQATDVMLVLFDPDFNFVWVNPAYADSCRKPPQDLIGTNHFALYPDEENEAIFRRVRDTGEAVFYKDKPFEFPDQPERGLTYWDWSLIPVKAADGGVCGLVFSLRETTRYKRAEQELRASEARFRQLADSMPQLVWTAEPDGCVDYYNHRVTDFDGMSQGPDGGRTWQPVLHPDDVHITRDAWQSALACGEPYECEHRIRLADGSLRWHLSRAVPVPDETGRVVKWYGSSTDIHELKQAQEALQEADRRKDEFLATLAHELRNPLAPIRNAVEILKLQGTPESAAKTARDMIDRQVAHMVRLIDDLLDVSRITRGKLHLRRERVDLAAVLEQVLEASRPLAECANHDLSLELPPYPIHLDADPVRLAQLFSNLLNNACKYTDPGGRIRLAVEPAEKEVTVTVEDNGIGIPAEHLSRVFDMFSQVPWDSERSQTGLGIGLSLVRGLVEMHGGRIEAGSEGRGKGSIFTVRLPLADASARKDDAEAKIPEGQYTPSARILVVDDNKDVVESLALLLRLHGNSVETARDGLEAVAQAERIQPDLVLLDIGMPRLDGYGACERMRQQPWGKDLTIVALTGWGQDDDRRKTEEAGFDGHLVKPVDPDAVLRLLTEGKADTA